jgi:hypothetical protein
MALDLSSSQEDAIQADNVRIGFLYKAEYDGATVRAWTGFEDIKYDEDGDGADETFLGVGEFGRFGEISEQTEVRAEGFTVQLAGVPLDGNGPLEDALREDYQGRDAKLWMALLDENLDIIDEPILLNAGFQDVHEVSDDANSMTVTVNIENPMRNLRRKATLHYTSEDQQRNYPNDRFFDHVEQIQQKQERWGPNV